jgi:hypothetical protein
LLTIRQYRKNWQSRIIFVKYFNVQLSRKQNGLMRMQPKGMLKKRKKEISDKSLVQFLKKHKKKRKFWFAQRCFGITKKIKQFEKQKKDVKF